MIYWISSPRRCFQLTDIISVKFRLWCHSLLYVVRPISRQENLETFEPLSCPNRQSVYLFIYLFIFILGWLLIVMFTLVFIFNTDIQYFRQFYFTLLPSSTHYCYCFIDFIYWFICNYYFFSRMRFVISDSGGCVSCQFFYSWN